MLRDFVSRNELQYGLSGKVGMEEVREVLNSRVASAEVRQET